MGPVFLHIGLPKTGTTFLQRRLRGNAELLASRGVLYPGGTPAAHFHAAIELRRTFRDWGVTPEQVAGSWQRLVEEARAFSGSTIIGHEILAAAGPKTIRRVRDDLAEAELHLVVTVRDVGRQIPAWWQEWVKNGTDFSFDEVMKRRVLPEWDAETKKSLFWRSQDLVDVLRRWGAAVPPERTHVVISPQPREGVEELWYRFGDAVGIPRDVAVEPEPATNESLGIAETALLRAVNEALGGRLQQPYYGRVVKHYLARDVLSPRSSARPMLPEEWSPRVDALTTRWIDHLQASGVQLHGALDDLRPVIAGPEHPAPDDVAAADLAELAPRALAEVLLEVARLRQELGEAHGELGNLRRFQPLLRAGVRAKALGRRLTGRARRAG